MNLNLEALRALGVPEELIAAATEPPSRVLKEKRKKLYVNQTRQANALFRICCLLDKTKPTSEATRAVEFHMEAMAARVERRLQDFQAQIKASFGVPSRAPGSVAKAARATRQKTRPTPPQSR